MADVAGRYSPTRVWYRRRTWWLRRLCWRVVFGLDAGLRRAVDVGVSLAILLALAPLGIAALSVSTLRREPRLGRFGESFRCCRLDLPAGLIGRLLSRLGVQRLPVLWNILMGDMSFVGPRPLSPASVDLGSRAMRDRLEVRPGLVCLWWIRERANIAYGREVEADGEYAVSQDLPGDLGIALRAGLTSLYGKASSSPPPAVARITGIPIHNLTMDEAVNSILDLLTADAPSQVCFVNPACANMAHRDPQYDRILKGAGLALADGIGMHLAGKVLGQHLQQNVNGTDLFPRLCQSLSATGQGVFLLGGRPGVAQAVAGWIAEHHPRVVVCGSQHGYFADDEEEDVVARIASSGARLLLVALGVPRQEKWIDQHLSDFGVGVAMGVGGLFDFISGRIPRAPLWLRELGLEWAYRFYQEPRRMWKRYFLGNAVFLYRVWRERLRRSHPNGQEA